MVTAALTCEVEEMLGEAIFIPVMVAEDAEDGCRGRMDGTIPIGDTAFRVASLVPDVLVGRVGIVDLFTLSTTFLFVLRCVVTVADGMVGGAFLSLCSAGDKPFVSCTSALCTLEVI